MSEYIHKSHNVTVLLYHLVFPAKYRRAVFDAQVDETLRNVCLAIVDRYQLKFLEVGADEDHVHFLVQSVPTYTVTKLVTVIKSITARKTFRLCPHVKKQLWGGEFNIYTTNSLTDELDIEEERHVVEGALIEYFQCTSQKLNEKAEHTAFVKRMRSLQQNNKISRVAVWLGIEEANGYFTFFSSARTAKNDHFFAFDIVKDELNLTLYKDQKELYQSLGIYV